MRLFILIVSFAAYLISSAQSANNRPMKAIDSIEMKKTKSDLHQFKQPTDSYILEAERKGTMVRLFLKMDNIEQYEDIVLVRANSELANFTDVKHIDIPKEANKLKYLEIEDRFPFPTKVATAYKIKATTKAGAIIMFPAIALDSGVK